jgi:hypothetical protein
MSPHDHDWLARLADPADRLAAGDFAECWLPQLIQHLRRRPDFDEHLACEAAGTAVLDFLHHPERFNPDLRSLAGYLKMAAEGDYRNALSKERRRAAKRVFVELDGHAGNEVEDDPPRLDDFPELAAVRDSLSEPDRAVLDLMRAGERATAAFAAVLGLAHLPDAGQRAEVKRVKDRIVQRLRRAVRRDAT